MEPMQNIFSLTESYDKRLNYDTERNNEDYSDLMELMIIIGKSLVNDKEKEKLWIDVPRLKEELILWRYYREGSISCFLLTKDQEINDSLVSTGIISILPLIIGNQNLESLEQELALFSCQTNQSPENLILFLLMGKAVHGVMHKEYSDADSFVSFLKEYLIHLNYERVFQKISKKNRMDKISYEKGKVQWIMDLDRSSKSEIPTKKNPESISKLLFIQSIHLFIKHHENPRTFNELEKSEVPVEVKVFTLLLTDLRKRKLDSDQRPQVDEYSSANTNFLQGMDRYFNKLKHFEIEKSPLDFEKLKIPNAINTKDLFSMKEGEKGKHPILRSFEVVQKKLKENCITLEVKTKTRVYKLKKPLA
ncbi:hypothetical protein [Isachenkonia alkalipeptolytica]|uniref:Uncharacterized protein n=1 Tax=Isachenkonia alkalipeptolytica TaxID=2565777 RepID=A0AA44BE18_9CLOT|nr:hypothetical protein [Isachenkonia alkalipeptolytica]NBG88542.1 hypothetical protein [Isachenkonia alkalipeptolytica]